MMTILLMTPSFDEFQSQGPFNIFWWLTVKHHQGLHWQVCKILVSQVRTSSTGELPKSFSLLTSALTTGDKTLLCLNSTPITDITEQVWNNKLRTGTSWNVHTCMTKVWTPFGLNKSFKYWLSVFSVLQQ